VNNHRQITINAEITRFSDLNLNRQLFNPAVQQQQQQQQQATRHAA
jgi:hypothetical protein